MTELLKSITSMANIRHPVVDVHTHVYLPRYAAELRARTSAPRILNWTNGVKTEERLLILDGEPSGGRPIGPQVCLLFSNEVQAHSLRICQYWDRDEKLEFMRRHGINISFVRFVCLLLQMVRSD
jgi:hypothetical protein